MPSEWEQHRWSESHQNLSGFLYKKAKKNEIYFNHSTFCIFVIIIVTIIDALVLDYKWCKNICICSESFCSINKNNMNIFAIFFKAHFY